MAHYQDNSAGNGKVEPAHNDSPDNSLKEIDTELSRNIADRINKISINIKLNDLSQLKDELYEIYDLLVSSRNAYIQIGDPNTRHLLPIKFSHNQTSFGDPSYSFEIGLRDKSTITDQDVSDAALIFNLICDLIEPQNSRLYTDVAEINKASFIPVDHGSHTLTLLEPFLFNGPVLQEYPQGAVLVTDGKNTWGVATEIFISNFKRLVDEKEYDLSSVDELYAL